MNLKGKHALVTGSTSGIGLGIAEGLAKEGVHLVLNGFGDAAEIETLRQRLATDYGVQVIYDGADMSKGADIARMMAEVAAKTGGLDIVVNNAGIQHVSPVEDFPEAKWDAIIAINLSAAFHTTKAAIPHMKQHKWGRIVRTNRSNNDLSVFGCRCIDHWLTYRSRGRLGRALRTFEARTKEAGKR
ncbi:MAG: SDR family NAD(P)-dependent oxidoreductase [Betaproteobacteria bacterium]|nr:SDR family NAD(P)-dependent oxidoreductase [Betaproteobacteria bacterium]